MLKRASLHIIIVSVAAVIMTACGPTKTTRVTGAYSPSSKEIKWPEKNDGTPLPPHSEALLSEARTWLGVPYKFGGNDKRGVDCSGLVLQVYKDALGINLPRNSREQKDYCTSISKGGLIPGDLIFFALGKDRKRVSHVGIFIGDNLMIHASASKGVILSDITAPYYTRNYAGSGIVEKYHAMLDEKSKKTRKGRKGKSEPKISPTEGPVISIPRTEATEGYTLTPVEDLPRPALQQSDTIASAMPRQASETRAESPKATTAAKKPITTVSASSSANTPEPTTEEARAAVLNSIKEKEL